jgi:hypothetical protein
MQMRTVRGANKAGIRISFGGRLRDTVSMTLHVAPARYSHTEAVRPKEIPMVLNPRFAQAMAIARSIPKRKNKRAAILKWCEVAKSAIGGAK